MRKTVSLGLILTLAAAALAPQTHAELTDAEKRALFLRSREDIRAVPRPTTTPRPRPSPAARATPTPAAQSAPPAPESTPKPRATPKPEPTPKPTPEPPVRPATTPDSTPPPPADDPPEPKPTVTPRPKATPKPTPTPKPKATPEPKTADAEKAKEDDRAKPDAPIVVEKSGKADDEGFVAPPKEKKGFLFFGGGPKYKYLTPSIRDAIDKAKVKRGRWKYIIVHNSGTRQGNAKAFDNYHKKVRKMPNGLAYHFVIGNGTSSGNGEIEIGNRWVRQINGGHVASDYLNNIAIGICFVGDFNRDLPTKDQVAALSELINYLRRRCGKSSGKNIQVRGHRQINPKPTDCPGNRFPLKWLNGEFKD